MTAAVARVLLRALGVALIVGELAVSERAFAAPRVEPSCPYLKIYVSTGGRWESASLGEVVVADGSKQLRVDSVAYDLSDDGARQRLRSDVASCGVGQVVDPVKGKVVDGWEKKAKYAIPYVHEAFKAIHERHAEDVHAYGKASDACATDPSVSTCGALGAFSAADGFPWAETFHGAADVDKIVTAHCSSRPNAFDFRSVEQLRGRIAFLEGFSSRQPGCKDVTAHLTSLTSGVERQEERLRFIAKCESLGTKKSYQLSKRESDFWLQKCLPVAQCGGGTCVYNPP
jgi:hypothetical protein